MKYPAKDCLALLQVCYYSIAVNTGVCSKNVLSRLFQVLRSTSYNIIVLELDYDVPSTELVALVTVGL